MAVVPADAVLLRDIASACFDDAAVREPDGIVRVIAMSETAAHRLRALADVLEQITREDVEAIDALAREAHVDFTLDQHTPPGVRAVIRLRAKLAALLPPE